MAKDIKNMPPKARAKKGTFKRLFIDLFKNHKKGILICMVTYLLMSCGNLISPLFVNFITSAIQEFAAKVRTEEVIAEFARTLAMYLGIMAGLYGVSLIAALVSNLTMATVCQDFTNEIRKKMFNHMQTLPVKYFDTHKRGDIMSTYTNDVDTFNQLIRQCLPNLYQTTIMIISLIVIMNYFSLWLSLIIVFSTVVMAVVAKKVGNVSGKYFRKQQEKFGVVEGNAEEAINGLKVIKVFSHEKESEIAFDKISTDLANDSVIANTSGNILGPIIMNIGNLLYVILALVGALFIVNNVTNISISGRPMSPAIIVTFLMMARMFSGNVNNFSQQVGFIFLGSAGASRIYDLIDEKSEVDEGYVTLVHVKESEDGTLIETKDNTRLFAWKHPHGDGTLTYTKVQGDIQLVNVDFGYNSDRLVLKNISVYAHPNEKIALVGATGAGKTTITNLINRFYDIEDGKVRYDGININKIKKSSLRKSLGIVLQDTNLFTGTIMENIRYGNLEATDDEVIKASKVANAYDFIMRLPKGFDTEINGDGSNLSQGQRQLLNIARAAVANVPVLILDEATSSIDTRTELLVQKGMDQLMENRTTFVIAHRLSTIKRSNCIMVLDHGVIIERGTHQELIDKKGVYYQLYTGAFELE